MMRYGGSLNSTSCFQEVLQLGKLPSVLSELKNILMSPIRAPRNRREKKLSLDDDPNKPFSEEDEDKVSSTTEEQQNKNGPQNADASEASATTDEVNLDKEENSENKEQDDGEEEEEEEDLPSEIVRVMGKACTQILVTQPDEECCLTYLGLLERVLSHEAFSQNDKRRLQSWKAQCQKLARQLATNRKLAGIEKGPKK